MAKLGNVTLPLGLQAGQHPRHGDQNKAKPPEEVHHVVLTDQVNGPLVPGYQLRHQTSANAAVALFTIDGQTGQLIKAGVGFEAAAANYCTLLHAANQKLLSQQVLQVTTHRRYQLRYGG